MRQKSGRTTGRAWKGFIQPPGASRKLDPGRNSLNAVRLLLAFLVLFAHSYTLSGNGEGPTFNDDHLGMWAVYCFFCLSGYLVTGSRMRTRFTEYLSHRIARIYPGFFVSLLVVAFGFAPIAYLREHGTIDGFLSSTPTPFHYVLANIAVSMREYGIAGTIATNPYRVAWNGSLWSLYYEFLCYLIIGGLLTFIVIRRRPTHLVLVYAVTVLMAAFPDATLGYFGGDVDMKLLITLLPFFMAGAMVYALRDWVPLAWWSAVPAFVAFIALVMVDEHAGPAAAAPFLTLTLLWLGKVLPCPPVLRRHDISYGCYIYAFPSQQLVAAFGGAAYGTYAHAALSLPSTVVLAIASWLLVERPAMRAVRGQARSPEGAEAAWGEDDPAQNALAAAPTGH